MFFVIKIKFRKQMQAIIRKRISFFVLTQKINRISQCPFYFGFDFFFILEQKSSPYFGFSSEALLFNSIDSILEFDSIMIHEAH